MLQWGRVLEDAETHQWHTPAPSLNSLQWGRVVEDAETAKRPCAKPPASVCFNGAASWKTRKLALTYVQLYR